MSKRKPTVRFAVDFANRQIIATEASLNRAKRYDSAEYSQLCKLVAVHPDFAVVAKEIDRNKSKRTYKNLNFAFIEKYISIQPEAEAIKREYEQVKKDAMNLGLGVYPYTKRWFLKRFGGEGNPFDMDAAGEYSENREGREATVGKSVLPVPASARQRAFLPFSVFLLSAWGSLQSSPAFPHIQK